jgi:MFS superfamily sulfate permease-like transporter
MLVAPSLLIGILGAAYFIPMIPQAVLLGYMVNLMYLTVGWHYTKQAFGCTMVYAKYDNYKISKWQKELLRWGLLSIWWVTLVKSNLYGSKSNFYGLGFMQWDFYDWLYPVSLVISSLSFFGILIFVFFKNWQTDKSWPSANMLIPFIAMCVWWLPVARQNEFYIYLTPFFHSLQYLVFIYKFETVSAAEKSANSQTLIWVSLFLIISGWAAFELIPNGLDQAFMSRQNLSIPFFLIAFNLFINIHHYFIDNAIWRFKDPEVKKHILAV